MSALTPKAGITENRRPVRLVPTTRSAAKILFDHLVGATGHRRRDGDTEHFGGLEVEERDGLPTEHALLKRMQLFLARRIQTCLIADSSHSRVSGISAVYLVGLSFAQNAKT